jgi:hypothetical protein
MRHAGRSFTRTAVVVLAVSVLAAVAAALASTRGGPTAAAGVRLAPTPPATVTATLIKRPTGTLPRGTLVRSSRLGLRVFVNADQGVALAGLTQAQYPVRTLDGGKTWRTDGPALHVNAAQAPLTVTEMGAANAHTFFAFGEGQVVDVTSDNGAHWYRAFLGDDVLAVVSRPGKLVAIAQVLADGTGTKALTWVYISKDGGRHWHFRDVLI